MNTVARVDIFLSALMAGVDYSTSLALGHSPVKSEQDESVAEKETPTPGTGTSLLPPKLPPNRRRRSGPGRKRRARPKPTSSSIKLPPPSTPFFLRIALALWSILLSFWRSLVGETRAERKRRTRQRASTLERARTHTLSLAGEVAGGMTSDDGSGSDGDGDGDGDDAEAPRGWVDPVTRAPADQEGVDEPSDDEFTPPVIPSKPPTPDQITFRLRSADQKEVEPPTISPYTPQSKPPSILSNPIPASTSSNSNTPRTRQARLLPNPMSTSLLDPSIPASKNITCSAPTIPSRSITPRLHQTPFHLQKTLILDLDETLIHSTSRPISYTASAGGGLLGLSFGGLLGGRKSRREGHTVEVVLNGRSTLYHVYKRPYVDHFLKKVASWYTLIIYTASMPEYADPVIDWLDGGRGLFAKRFYRDSCFLQPNGSYIKDLALVEKDLSRVCFMDNSPISYSWNKANALPIEGWTSDPYDEALLQSIPVLDSLRFVNDVRRILGIRGFT